MAKNEPDSNESANALTNESSSEATPYINDDATQTSRFGWIKSRPAKIAAISVGGALALGAVFAGGVVAGQVSSHNNGPAIGAPFENGEHRVPGDSGKFGQLGGKHGPDGDRDGEFGDHPPRPPHDFDGQPDGDGPQFGDPNGKTETTPEVQSN